MKINKIMFLFSALLLWASPVSADDEASVETEALEIADTLHCSVCSDPNIEIAKDEIAKDLRLFIRKHLTDGKPQELVINLVLSNYGDVVTLDAPSPDKSEDNEYRFIVFLNVFFFAAVLFYIFRRSKPFRAPEAKDGEP